jgi:hypothetical protein
MSVVAFGFGDMRAGHPAHWSNTTLCSMLGSLSDEAQTRADQSGFLT